MTKLAHKAIAHPRTALLAWLVAAVGLGILGSTIEGRFSPSVLVAKGTESARAEKIAQREFGASVLTPVMLTGPARALDDQGPALAAALRRHPDIRVLSPWDGTPGSDVLRPEKGAATIVAAVQRPEKKVIEDVLPQIERSVDRTVSGSVAAHITGQAVIDRAMRDESLDQTRVAVAIAIPLVLIALTLVLRAPLAAFAVTAFAVVVLPVGYGLTAISASLIRVDAIAVAGASMVGLALAVGFGVLMVSRFRDELEGRSGDPRVCARAAADASVVAGRAVLIAGTAMVVGMILASILSIPEVLNSIGIGATLMAGVATLGALTLLPPALALPAGHIAAEHLGHPAPASRHRRFTALPVAAGLTAIAVMAALSLPVFSMSSGPPDAKMLPPDNQAREDYEAVASVMGPGWVSPFEVVVAHHGSPVTTRRYLRELSGFEAGLAKDKQVESVLGPGALLANANELQGVPEGLNTAAETAKSSKKDLKKLINGLRLATGGVAQLRGGLGEAADGAGQLHGGTGQAYSGSGQLASGLGQADAGAKLLKEGSAQAAAGARDLASGLKLAQAGVSGGLPTIQKLIDAVNSNAQEVRGLEGGVKATKDQIAAAAASLAAMEIGHDDPHYSAVVAGLQQAASKNDQLAAAITTAAVNAELNATTIAVVKQQVEDLKTGIGKLRAGGDELASGLRRLASGNSDLAGGIAKLDAGGAQLQDGLRQLNDGAGQLADGLGSGIAPSGELLAGMHTITGSVVKAREEIPSTAALEKLRKEAPGLFDSGYFVLAAIDGAPAPARDAASFVVNVDEGGYAGRVTVVPKQPATEDVTVALRDRLSERTEAFATATKSQAAVGGTAANLIDYQELAQERLPVVLGALALLTVIVLAAVTRSLIVPAAAVALNALTAGAAIGTLALLFGGDDPLLGGPGYVDPVSIIAIVTIVLALAIDYEVFGLERLRMIPSAGLAMGAALIAFIPVDVTLIREFAIGMTVAVIVDSLVVRRLLVGVKRGGWRLPRIRIHPPRPVHH